MRRWSLRLADVAAVIAVIAAVAVIVHRLGDASAQPAKQPATQQAATPTSTPEPAATPTAPELPPADDCKRKGITRKAGGEGACYEPSGRRVRVVNRASRLDLDELTAEVRGIDVRRRPALDSATVTVRVWVRSKLDGIVGFRPEQAGLLLGDRFFALDGPGEATRAGSLVRRAATLKAGESAEGTLRFDVGLRYLRRLDINGNVQLLQFSDVSLQSASATVGIFRTYR